MSCKVLTYREQLDNVHFNVESLDLTSNSYSSTFNKTHRGITKPINCYSIEKNEIDTNSYKLSTSYFIGVDWIEEDSSAIYICPKLNKKGKELDFIGMLFSAMKHQDVAKEIDQLYEVNWDSTLIPIEQKSDFLTPFLIVEFLSLLKIIVKKGLKKSYYKVEKKLNGRIKGKLLTGKTIKETLVKNNQLSTVCSFDEFGVDNVENRVLKKALSFVKLYIPRYSEFTSTIDLQDVFNYINPAFISVSDKIELNDVKQVKNNVFYPEYSKAIRIARLIMRRFGYNISNTAKNKINTPPFWIDMSKLFELYTLGLLKDRFSKKVQFQYKYYGNELDYLLNSEDYKMVIDAKYKLIYINNKHDEDVRQVSGYARLKSVYKSLGLEQGKIIDCLIIYPDQDSEIEDLNDINLKGQTIPQYFDVYKLGIKLPYLN